jgi:hypothetical protein
MVKDAQPEDIRTIRDRLLASFTAEELRRLFLFASDARLRPVVLEFSPADGLSEMVAKAIVWCQNRDLLPALLAEVAQERPEPGPAPEPRLTPLRLEV